MDSLVPIGWRVAVLRTPNALTYGATPGCHTPTSAPGIDAWRMTRSTARVNAAALGRVDPLAVAAGPVTTAKASATSAANTTTRPGPEEPPRSMNVVNVSAATCPAGRTR
jgi:hypothetical protein